MSCVLARVTKSIEASGGPDKVALEISIAEAYFMKANRRIVQNFRSINRNEDDQLHFIAEQLYEKGQYPFDFLG